MSATHLEARGLAALAAVPQGKMRRNDLITEEEFSCLADAAQKECEFCGIVDGVKRELDLRRIRLAALHMKSRSGLSLVVIDYDEMIDVDGEAGQQRKRTPRPLDEFERLRIVARAAKQIALQLECVVILVSQLRKPLTGEDAEFPTLQSVYGNQAKVKNATGVLLVHRPYVDNWTGEETDATLFVLKNRDGRRSKVPCTFDIAKLEFHDAARDAFSEADAKAEKK